MSECNRCGGDFDPDNLTKTLDGDLICPTCRRHLEDQEITRSAWQSSMEDWADA